MIRYGLPSGVRLSLPALGEAFENHWENDWQHNRDQNALDRSILQGLFSLLSFRLLIVCQNTLRTSCSILHQPDLIADVKIGDVDCETQL